MQLGLGKLVASVRGALQLGLWELYLGLGKLAASVRGALQLGLWEL